ncbi:MAG: hypothetical protein HYX92_03155 [Chloroflexi bacterium]|nr:hypothetical protein [Chloroflexota bacterium]
MSELISRRFAADDFEAAIEFIYRNGWTDGLPVIPATEAKIRRFLEVAGLEPEYVIGRIPERDRIITAEKLAINAIMAGCLPEYMPLLVAAVEAVTAPEFKFNHLASMGSPWPALIVNGPISQQLGINSGMYVLGPGCRPNATIGRAISLLLWNCAEARPDGVQRGQWGHQGRWSTCIAEDESTEWEPLHVQLGFDRASNVLTVVSHYPSPVIVATSRAVPERILDAVADCIATNDFIRGIYVLMVPRQFAEIFISAGWSKADIRDYLFEHSRRSIADLKRRGRWNAIWGGRKETRETEEDTLTIKEGDESEFAYVLKSCEYDEIMFSPGMLARRHDVFVVVCGGNAGSRVAFLTPYGTASDAVTRPITMRGARGAQDA